MNCALNAAKTALGFGGCTWQHPPADIPKRRYFVLAVAYRGRIHIASYPHLFVTVAQLARVWQGLECRTGLSDKAWTDELSVVVGARRSDTAQPKNSPVQYVVSGRGRQRVGPAVNRAADRRTIRTGQSINCGDSAIGPGNGFKTACLGRWSQSVLRRRIQRSTLRDVQNRLPNHTHYRGM